MEYRNVVTSFLQFEDLILLLRRSNRVGTYRDKWAAVSGFLEGSESPLERAMTEIMEEVGLHDADLELVRSGKPLRVYEEQQEIVWIVHPFLFRVTSQRVITDWEHSEHIWVDPSKIASFETVPKLKEAFDRVRWNLDNVTQNLMAAIQIVQEIAQDRVNGANYLGRKAISAIQAAAQLSSAQSFDDLFRDILIVNTKLRDTQPSMATIANLTGKLLYALDSLGNSSPTHLRQVTISLAAEIVSKSELALEQVARNASRIISGKRSILTHSYSTTVKRSLQLCEEKPMTLIVTDSAPGFEGRALARDLANFGLTVHILPDNSATEMKSRDIDCVVVGADGILTDGSVVNKSGTRGIALVAHNLGIPLYVLAETAKFNTMQFLGKPLQLTSLFDVTSSEHVSCLITELGELKPSDVELQIKAIVRELYT